MSVTVISMLRGMARWEPGARERLRTAALELYVGQGYEQTTVEEIARAVGLTERTFFRYFADKREVLFDGQDLLQKAFVEGVDEAGPDASPLTMVASALAASAGYFAEDRREWSRRRHAVIAANPALRERELLKLATVTAVVADALQARGVAERAAVLAAETGMTAFGVAFARWVAAGEERSFPTIEREVLAELATLAAGLASVVVKQVEDHGA